MRLSRLVIAAVVLASLLAGTVFAQVVMVPGKETGPEVVEVRKFVMRALNTNLRDIRLKLEKGQGGAVIANGAAIAAVALTMPPFFLEPYRDQYPYQGSKWSFKGAAPVEFQAAAEYLNSQAQKLVRTAADDKIKETEQAMNRLKKACISCHDQFRGEG